MTTRACLVTGGGAGSVGHVVALEFAKLGYKVAITGLSKERVTQAHLDMRAAAPPGTDFERHFMAAEIDFLDQQQTDHLVQRVVERFGHLDIIVNNDEYMGRHRAPLDEDYYEEFRRTIRANLFAPTRLAQLAAPYLMAAPGGGVFINVSSVAEVVPFKNGAYSVSKAGVGMLTKLLANSYGKHVRVLSVSPGPTRTIALGDDPGRYSTVDERCASPEEVANMILFLCSADCTFMTGSTVLVDGGFCCRAGPLAMEAIDRGCMEHMNV